MPAVRWPRAEHRDRAGLTGLGAYSWPSALLAGEGHERSARFRLPAVEHGWRGRRHGAVTLNPPADDLRDPVKTERDHVLRTAISSAPASMRNPA